MSAGQATVLEVFTPAAQTLISLSRSCGQTLSGRALANPRSEIFERSEEAPLKLPLLLGAQEHPHFSPDRRHFWIKTQSQMGDGLDVYEAETGNVVTRLKSSGSLKSVQWAAESQYLVSHFAGPQEAGVLEVFNLAHGRGFTYPLPDSPLISRTPDITEQAEVLIKEIEFSPARLTFAVRVFSTLYYNFGTTRKPWQTLSSYVFFDESPRLAPLQVFAPNFDKDVSGLVWSRNSNVAVVGYSDGSREFWDLDRREQMGKLAKTPYLKLWEHEFQLSRSYRVKARLEDVDLTSHFLRAQAVDFVPGQDFKAARLALEITDLSDDVVDTLPGFFDVQKSPLMIQMAPKSRGVVIRDGSKRQFVWMRANRMLHELDPAVEVAWLDPHTALLASQLVSPQEISYHVIDAVRWKPLKWDLTLPGELGGLSPSGKIWVIEKGEEGQRLMRLFDPKIDLH